MLTLEEINLYSCSLPHGSRHIGSPKQPRRSIMLLKIKKVVEKAIAEKIKSASGYLESWG